MDTIIITDDKPAVIRYMFENVTNWTTVISWIVTFFEITGALIIFCGSAQVVVELVTNALHRKSPNYTAIRDLRKFTEQYGDIIQWDQSNRAYIMTHGVSGIDWKHHEHPLPEHVYDVYIKYW
ncbi:MAG: hypothetical protein ACXWEP_04930 [Halobacteriota archaeon]